MQVRCSEMGGVAQYHAIAEQRRVVGFNTPWAVLHNEELS